MGHAKLLDIAIREFATKGVDGASTRCIAAAAGTAMSSITYHYGSKAGLYLAAADYIAGEMDEFPAEYGTEAIIFSGDAARARETVKAILGRMTAKLGAHANENWSLFIVREQMNPTEGFERIWRGPIGRMFDALVELVCVVTGNDDRRVARIAVMTLFGQVVVLRTMRATCARLFDDDPADPTLIAQFTHRVDVNTDAILDALTGEVRNEA